jgi:hypothetical protein
MVDALTLGFGALLLLALALIAYAGKQVLAAPRKATAAEGQGPGPSREQALIARQVVDEQGNRLGETVRVEGDDVVVSRGGAFLVLPRASLEEHGEKLRAVELNLAEAEARGEAWRKKQEDVMAYDDKGMPLPER